MDRFGQTRTVVDSFLRDVHVALAPGNLNVNIYVFPPASDARQESRPATDAAQLVHLNEVLPDIINRSGILETALRRLAEEAAAANTSPFTSEQQATDPETDPSNTRAATSEMQLNENTPFAPVVDPERYGFIRMDPQADHEDENTLYWREQHHARMGSAADGSFSGPYTRDEMLQIIRDETS